MDSSEDTQKKSVPLKLKRIREQKGYTLRELASEIGVNFSLISYWEHGKKKPKRANRMKLEKALDTKSEVLFSEDVPDD